LASGSQDATIRLWKVEEVLHSHAQPKETPSDEILDDFEASMIGLTDGEEGGRQISLKCHMLTVKDQEG
jgi:elongator complex protein 2